MKIIIAGAGDIGIHLAKMLSKEDHDIIVIDKDSEKLDFLESHFDVIGMTDNAMSPSVLQNADTKNTDLFIAVTESEETNITSALLAKKIGAKKTVARIDNKEYLENSNKDFFHNLGVDSLIYPQKLAAEEIVELLKQSGINEKINFNNNQLTLSLLRLDQDAPIINKTLKEVIVGSNIIDCRAIAICRNNETIIPKGDNYFRKHDLVYTISTKKGLKHALKLSGKENDVTLKNIMILGGSRIGKRLAKELQNNFSVKIIEKDLKKCEMLTNELDNTLILHGDGNDTELLLEEGIKKIDAFIAVTENSETNILSCLLAKNFGVKKTIAEIENIDFINLAENIGIDTIINKKLITASYILSYTIDAEVNSIKMLTGTDAEVLELIAHKNSKVVGRPLSQIKFPKDAIIGGIMREEKSIIAKGDTIIYPNDKVVVFSLPSAIHKIEKLFK